jgi:diguanylate cyclase
VLYTSGFLHFSPNISLVGPLELSLKADEKRVQSREFESALMQHRQEKWSVTFMKSWVKKIADQFDLGIKGRDSSPTPEGAPAVDLDISDERATVLYLLDIYSKNLFDFENHPVRKTREVFDDYAKSLLKADYPDTDKLLFRIRQFFSAYRVDEYSYIQRSAEEFKSIIWDFADQLGEDIQVEKAKEIELRTQLEELREAVESNAMEKLKHKSREFIDTYVQYQTQKDERRNKRLGTMSKSLQTMKKQLAEAQTSLKVDHLTQAYNRKSFDEQGLRYHQLYGLSKGNICLLMFDIDHFKKVNDTYGHDIGDHVIKECVRFLKESFQRDNDLVARLGGEEFAVILPDFDLPAAAKKVEECLGRIRRETIIHKDISFKFTVSCGIAQLMENETFPHWLKRADMALYQSKNSGRDRYTVAAPIQLPSAA